MTGGDVIPTPLNPQAVRDIATNTALRVMIRSLSDLEISIKHEKRRLYKELRALEEKKA